MAAEYRDKRTLITTVRGAYLSFATFPSPLLPHYPLPLSGTKPMRGMFRYATNNAPYEEQRKRVKRHVTQTAGAKVLGVGFISVHSKGTYGMGWGGPLTNIHRCLAWHAM